MRHNNDDSRFDSGDFIAAAFISFVLGFAVFVVILLYNVVASRNEKIELITQAIPDIVTISKQNIDNVVYDNNEDKVVYLVTTKDKTYTVIMDAKENEQSTYDFTIRELTSKDTKDTMDRKYLMKVGIL